MYTINNPKKVKKKKKRKQVDTNLYDHLPFVVATLVMGLFLLALLTNTTGCPLHNDENVPVHHVSG